MKLLDPEKISAEIIILMREAKEKLILVSPYNKFDKWYKLTKFLEAARDRLPLVEFYVRAGEEESIKAVRQINLEPVQIPNLHLKFYMNESVGIVTSLNLLLNSEINSLDIAYRTETKKEYDDLYAFYQKHIKIHKPKAKAPEDPLVDKWPTFVKTEVRKQLEPAARVSEEKGMLKLNVWSNVYHVSIATADSENRLCFSGVLSKKQYDKLKITDKSIYQEPGLKTGLKKGGRGEYDLFTAYGEKKMKSENILQVYQSESAQILTEIAKFVRLVGRIKKDIP